ncbi:acyltransferase family protein [Paraburkholderia bonniea]|uniref:acyltransferase family protein n=1 Tax=Paraburkholderia bonniea TaxID=2152891 RepID=UPI001291B77B|nr:acyltransferase family protein [Paraburkholderia bonniea]WJF90907.1 acyltransferase family protein [Paraburkholderia bonniea]WJF94221.1 acyltransferase family protein [Paraburkholderia bonniea]
MEKIITERGSPTSQRIDYVDAMKGVGIILVVFGHMLINGQDWISDRIFDYIYLFHMPLFFFISGFLFKPERHPFLLPFAAARFRSIILPYLIFTFFSVALFLPQAHRVTPIMLDIIMAKRQQMPFNEALWFLPALFVVEIAFFSIRKILRIPVAIFLVTLVASYLGYPYTSQPNLPWSADAAAYYLIFYCVGYYCANSSIIYNLKKLQAWAACAFITVAAVINIWGAILADKIPNYYKTVSLYYPRRYALFVLIAFSGIVLVAALGKLLENYQPLSRVGKNSLLILGLHIPIRFLILEPIVIWLAPEIYVAENNAGMFYFTIVCMTLVPFVLVFKKIMNHLS